MAGRRKISRIKWMLDFRKKMFFKHFITISKKKDNPTDMPMNYSQKTGKLCSSLSPIRKNKKNKKACCNELLPEAGVVL